MSNRDESSIRAIDPAIEFDPGYKAIISGNGSADQRAAMLAPFKAIIEKRNRERKQAEYRAKHHMIKRSDIAHKRPVRMQPIRPDDIKR